MKESFACIDPALPLCWEDPETLRLGFDRAEARISRPSAGTQRLLGVLQRGLPLSQLARASLLVGATAAERRSLIELVAPVLITRPLEGRDGSTQSTARGGGRDRTRGQKRESPHEKTGDGTHGRSRGNRRERPEVMSNPVEAPPLRVAILGSGGAAESLSSAVARAGWVPVGWPMLPSDALAAHAHNGSEIGGGERPRRERTSNERMSSEFRDTRSTPGLCIVVERFMQPPATFHALATSGVPHLAVRFTDRSVRVGPLVIPGRAPCVSCLSLSEVAADPGIPVLAAQLQGRFPAAETPASVEIASALALIYVHRWLRDSEWPHETQLRLTVAEGIPGPIPEERSVLPHPGCACATMSAAPGQCETSGAQPAIVSPASAMKREG